MIEFKRGVDLRGICPEIVLGLVIAERIFADYRIPLCCTAVRDGRHMVGSLHYQGRAVDLRLPSRYSGLPGIDKAVHADLSKTLGEQFDVLLEVDHIHLEFDPPAAPQGPTPA